MGAAPALDGIRGPAVSGFAVQGASERKRPSYLGSDQGNDRQLPDRRLGASPESAFEFAVPVCHVPGFRFPRFVPFAGSASSRLISVVKYDNIIE